MALFESMADGARDRAQAWWAGLRHFGAFLASIIASFQSLRIIRRRSINAIIMNQIRFTGIDAMVSVVFIALLAGGTVIIQAMTNLPRFGVDNYLGNVLVIIIARELGPLVTALIVISRSGSAMATEIAVQKWSREILSMEIMGIDTRLLIVFPRMVAATISIFSLNLFFDIVAFLGGWAISRTTIYIPLDVFFQNLLLAFTMKDLASTVLKSAIFGILVPLISCYYGFQADSKFQIPILVSKAVSRTLFAVVVINAGISALFYFWSGM